MLNRLTIGSRLALGFGLLTLLLIIDTAVATYGLRHVSATADRAIQVDTQVALNAVKLQNQALDARRYEKDVLISIDDAQERAAFKQKWDDNYAALAEAVRRGAQTAESDEQRALYRQAATLLGTYGDGFNRIHDRIRDGELVSTNAADAALEEYKAPINQFEQIAHDIDIEAEAHMAEMVEVMNAQQQQALVALLAFAAVCVVLAVLLAWLITRSITRPVRYAVSVVEDVAGGNLRRDISVDGRDEIAQLLTAMSKQRQTLAALVLSLRQLSESVYTGAREIALGNDELSTRTQEQAANLEETAASMEQMTSTVKQNADNSAQADQLARQVRSRAGEGNAVVQTAVQAMDEINASSRRISEIVGLIDDIAFQTNLLALNASVEAARAGEQGRGFAVVASEVRNLASRSAAAAKDIKSLVEDSAAKVADGSAQVALSGKTLDGIVESVHKVGDIIAEIAAASSEQSSGIEQVNLAVSQMDSMTQQNASLVEQSAAASRSLEEQAESLKRQVAFFLLSGDVKTVASVPAVNTAITATPATPAPAPASVKPAVPSAPAARQTSVKDDVDIDDGDWATF